MNTEQTEEEETIGGSIGLYPNPAHDEITIDYLITEDVSLTIYNVIGEQVYVQKLSASNNQVKINICNFTEGVYVCKLIDAENKSQTIKFNVVK